VCTRFPPMFYRDVLMIYIYTFDDSKKSRVGGDGMGAS